MATPPVSRDSERPTAAEFISQTFAVAFVNVVGKIDKLLAAMDDGMAMVCMDAEQAGSDGDTSDNDWPDDDHQPLRDWFVKHLDYPFPSRIEKRELAASLGLDARSIDSHLTNWRRRSGWNDIKRKWATSKDSQVARQQTADLIRRVLGGEEERSEVRAAINHVREYFNDDCVGAWTNDLVPHPPTTTMPAVSDRTVSVCSSSYLATTPSSAYDMETPSSLASLKTPDHTPGSCRSVSTSSSISAMDLRALPCTSEPSLSRKRLARDEEHEGQPEPRRRKVAGARAEESPGLHLYANQLASALPHPLLSMPVTTEIRLPAFVDSSIDLHVADNVVHKASGLASSLVRRVEGEALCVPLDGGALSHTSLLNPPLQDSLVGTESSQPSFAPRPLGDTHCVQPSPQGAQQQPSISATEHAFEWPFLPFWTDNLDTLKFESVSQSFR